MGGSLANFQVLYKILLKQIKNIRDTIEYNRIVYACLGFVKKVQNTKNILLKVGCHCMIYQ